MLDIHRNLGMASRYNQAFDNGAMEIISLIFSVKKSELIKDGFIKSEYINWHQLGRWIY